MKSIILSIIAAAVIIGGSIWLSNSRGLNAGSGDSASAKTTSTIVDGKQYIDITARGGYSPRRITAKAGMPAIIRMKTEGTFDCSSFLVIPAIDYRNNLPQSGVTEIPLPEKAA